MTSSSSSINTNSTTTTTNNNAGAISNTSTGGGWLRNYGQTVLAVSSTLLASVFTFKALSKFTSQREVLIAIFVILLLYVSFIKAMIIHIFCYDESIDYYKLLILNAHNYVLSGGIIDEDGDGGNNYDEVDESISFYAKKMYIDENGEVTIRISEREVIHPNKTPHPVKTALITLCDFISSVFVIALISILIEAFFNLYDNTTTLYWYNYVVIFVVPFFLVFVFIVFKHF